MKGVIFTEFVEFAEHEFGAQSVADVIAGSALPSGGRYSAIEHYDHAELAKLVDGLHRRSGLPAGTLLRRFGCYLFARFASLYPVFVVDANSAIDLLSTINSHIHGELLKLYPDSEFPFFECEFVNPKHLEMVYQSQRQLGDLAEGLIQGCVAHFGEPVDVRREDLPPSNDEQRVRFSLIAR